MTDEECPGPGRCHGCMCWCDHCGDVGLMCDSIQGECSRHHCYSCKQLLGPDDYNGDDWWALCRSCSFISIHEDSIRIFERHLERGDFRAAEYVAQDIAVNRDGEGLISSASELLWALYRPIGGILSGVGSTITRRAR